MQVWFINGDVECFTGGHTPLALLAMLVLLFCFLFIPLCCILAMLKVENLAKTIKLVYMLH